MMEDKAALEVARIAVEKINGPILSMSATNDEWWASKEMSDDMMARIKAKQFAHAHQHHAMEGDHAVPFIHLDQARVFLDTRFKRDMENGCACAIGCTLHAQKWCED